MIRTLAAVFVGGIMGSGARLALEVAMPTPPGSFPFAILLANTAGSLLLGVLVAGAWPRLSPIARATLAPGALGSFTTFSALAASTVQLPPVLALLNVAGSLLAGLAAALVGLRLGGRVAARVTARGGTP